MDKPDPHQQRYLPLLRARATPVLWS